MASSARFSSRLPKNGFFYVIDRENGELLRALPYATVTWATHVDMKTGRPVENPDLDYSQKEKWVLPGPLGGHNWQAMSVDVEAGLVFIPVQENPLIYGVADEFKQTGLFKRNPGPLESRARNGSHRTALRQ